MRYLAIFLALAGHAGAQIYSLPPKPVLSSAGLSLILEGETGGQHQYNRNPHPEWPGGPSGITWGIGYDATAQSENLILSDWRALAPYDVSRLATLHPYRGQAARIRLNQVRGILVTWKQSLEVFTAVDLARTWALCVRTFPGFLALRPNAQAAIASLVFNRGSSLIGPNRLEMRWIAAAVPVRDYERMAYAERHMKRIWKGTDIEAGMNNRREAEALLFLTP